MKNQDFAVVERHMYERMATRTTAGMRVKLRGRVWSPIEVEITEPVLDEILFHFCDDTCAVYYPPRKQKS